MQKNQSGFAFVLGLALLVSVAATCAYAGYVVLHKSMVASSSGRPKTTSPIVQPSLTSKPPNPGLAPSPSPHSAPATGTITGHFYSRCNSDPRSGCFSQNGVAGVTISLVDSKGKVIASTVTDKEGMYILTAPAGTYAVTDSLYKGSFEHTITAAQTYVVNIGG